MLNTPHSGKIESTFTFHFGKGDIMTLWAKDKADAIKRWHQLMGDTFFMLHDDWAAFMRKRSQESKETVIEGQATVVADTPTEAAVQPPEAQQIGI